MYTVGNKIYRKNDNILESIDIKYGTKKIIQFSSNIEYRTTSNNEYLVVFDRHFLYLLDGDNIKLKINNEIIGNINCLDFSIIDNYLVFRTFSFFDDAEVMVYNMDNGGYKIKKVMKYNILLQSPNKKNIIIRLGPMPSSDKSAIKITSMDADFNFFCKDYDNDRKYNYACWKNDDFVIGIKHNCSLINISIFDLDFKREIILDVEIFCVCFNQNRIAVKDDIIYLWDNSKILVIDNNVISCIKNVYKVQLYNLFYGLFINNKLKQYKIHKNKLVRYRHKYDLWCDINKPSIIELILNVLMVLMLFPEDVCNVLYHAMMKVDADKN